MIAFSVKTHLCSKYFRIFAIQKILSNIICCVSLHLLVICWIHLHQLWLVVVVVILRCKDGHINTPPPKKNPNKFNRPKSRENSAVNEKSKTACDWLTDPTELKTPPQQPPLEPFQPIDRIQNAVDWSRALRSRWKSGWPLFITFCIAFPVRPYAVRLHNEWYSLKLQYSPTAFNWKCANETVSSFNILAQWRTTPYPVYAATSILCNVGYIKGWYR